MVSKYSLLVEEWQDCQRCELASGRQRVIMARGKLPCQVLFIGEAPGESEDVLGKPFMGPAGQLLDKIIERGLLGEYSYCLTNLVACIPRDPEQGGKAAEPPDEAVQSCSPRLVSIVELAQPRLIVTVGNMARDWLDPKFRGHIKLPLEVPVVDIVHPAWILRQNLSQRGLSVQRCVITLRQAVEEYLQ